MKKEEIEQIVTEELEKYDMELPNYEYDTVAENIAERLVKLLAIPVVSNSCCDNPELNKGMQLGFGKKLCKNCGGHIAI